MATKDSITFKGIDFDFEYSYYAGRRATYEEPEEYEEIEVYNVKINGNDAEWLLESQWDEFVDEVLNSIKERGNGQ